MAEKTLSRRSRLDYFVYRFKALDLPSVWRRAREVGKQHGKFAPFVYVDMLYYAGFKDTGFQDYVDWDFAILTRAERATFMTNAISNHIALRYDAAAQRTLFEDKIAFNKTFGAYLHREWFEVEPNDADALRDFVTRHGVVIGKVPVSNSGKGVERYEAADVTDWAAFRAELLGKGQVLLEEYIRQHAALSAVSPDVVNTTRVTTFLDDAGVVQLLSFAQKFGIGKQASDQQAFGGFFTLMDSSGKSLGAGYGSHQKIYAKHPVTGASITDFQLPMADEVLKLVDEVSRVRPDIRYVGWDVVVTPDGPIIVEGNWMPGAYENKPSATGVRTGSLPRIRKIVGF
ncbi:MAG: flagellar biosynthesis protein [Microbacteriaceae bacterium]|nr:flagellar biosynthesis protein [Microbacteriaceae bacterium]MCL2795334.1 flagellar biosynthesis protein [Microbacteriaceae bacterium]